MNSFSKLGMVMTRPAEKDNSEDESLLIDAKEGTIPRESVL